ncbi:MAG: isoprenyl transferase [Deltaproteobacteria bacterium]|nr:isoprenyl transferase [Deltaproteobacteria bacterium]MBW2469812.1 isoprenyl transferase [Deltaproteobacteria bacterium]MBW2517342.1 isoprenyl transferase [Deltaproteobacteria bacterium]
MNSSSSSDSSEDLDKKQLPAHVAIIMDGNGRWAKKHLLSRIKGHEKGADAVRMVVRACRELGIAYLTLYAFSTENWQRPQKEVNALMTLLIKFLKSEQKELAENDIRLAVIGQVERLPADVQQALRETIDLTRHNSALQLNLALSYGSRSEIVRMAQQIARKAINAELEPEEIGAETVAAHLYTKDMPDPDLLIRTSGEMRVSNFLLWQIAYAEIFVSPTYWPDFGKEEFVEILKDYQRRERRFGRV